MGMTLASRERKALSPGHLKTPALAVSLMGQRSISSDGLVFTNSEYRMEITRSYRERFGLLYRVFRGGTPEMCVAGSILQQGCTAHIV
jgi:hypothetical protein